MRPSVDGNGLVSTIVRHAASYASSRVRPSASATARLVSHPRTSLPAGHFSAHGGRFSTNRGRRAVTPSPGEAFLMTGFLTSLNRAMVGLRLTQG